MKLTLNNNRLTKGSDRMTEQKTIMYESAEAATFKTGLEGWVSSDGRFWGKDEHIARFAGSTHKKCDCGNVISKSYTLCDVCRDVRSAERYMALEHKEWGGEPLVIYGSDTYFFNDEIYDYLNDFEGEDAPQLMICEPIIAPYIEEYGIDQLPEDWQIEDADQELANLIANVNEYIGKKKPILSWYQGKFRTTVTPTT